MKRYYFGCDGGAGHYLWHTNRTRVGRQEQDELPFAVSILDGGLMPKSDEQLQGECRVSLINGWTIVSYWDRSVDTRRGSISVFVYQGAHNPMTVMTMAKTDFAWVFGRARFEVPVIAGSNKPLDNSTPAG